MNKSIFLIIILMIVCSPIFSQLVFTCEKLSVSNVITKEDTSGMISEEHGGGPYFYFECNLMNSTDSIVCITPKYSIVDISFFYKHKMYYHETPIVNRIENILYLKPKQVISLNFGIDIFFFSDVIYSAEKKDYTKELIEVLPTLDVKYSDKGIVPIKCIIKNVEVHY